MTAASTLVMLAACQTSGSTPVVWHTNVPALDAELEQPCRDPGVRAGSGGKHLRGEIARNRQYAACEARKHIDTVAAYNGVRAANLEATP